MINNMTNLMTALVSNVTLILQKINGTDEGQSKATTPSLKIFHDILIIVLLLSVMFACGCSITFEQVTKN
jgi:hypothetical protein